MSKPQPFFSITITPSPTNDGFVYDLISDEWCADRAQAYCDFIGRMLTEHPDRPTVREN